MSKQQAHNESPAALDEQVLGAIRQEVRAQMAGLLEQLAARLRGPAAGPVALGSHPAAPGLTPQKVVVIAAAAAAVLQRPVRVKRITFINQNTISAWADAGRMSIHNSHRLGRSL